MSGMITANRLGDGVVVFQDARGAWTEDFHAAAVLADKQAQTTALAVAKESEARNEVIDPYWIDVESRGSHFVPKALREAIRATGPTVRPDLGKQAQGQAPNFVRRGHKETSHVPL
jgi:hypothetical protein